MARTISKETLEKKIGKAEQDVIRTKKAYDAATMELKKLLDKRDALRQEELMSAVLKSQKSYEEILAFLADEKEKTD